MTRPPFRPGIVVLLCIVAVPAGAQTAPPPEATGTNRPIAVVPYVSLTETLTDNARLESSGRQSDLITQLSAGLHLASTGGRFKGFLDYSLTGLAYARNSSNNEVQNSLNAAATAEAVENWIFVDVAANISQRAISAFGTQSSNPSLVNPNRTEVSTASVSPYVRGLLGDFASYNAKLVGTWTHGTDYGAANGSTSQMTAELVGSRTQHLVNWSADVSLQAYDFNAGRRTEDDRLRARIIVNVNPQLRLSALTGRESSNMQSLEKESETTSGWGVDWAPTDRTKLSALSERRFFGNSHMLSFEHRTPRTAWKYVDSKDVSTGFGQPTPGGKGTAYDLLFSQLASLVPDPELRGQYVDAVLQAWGIAPGTTIPGGALTSATMLERRQDLSFALLGIRDALILSASRNESRRLDAVTAVSDDFANASLVRQDGLNLSLAHRLTPLASLNVGVSALKTTGSVGSQSSKLRTIVATWSSRLGPKSYGSLGARHSVFDSPSGSYTESALIATLSLQL